jgi:oxygen-independent coproporphyrinogen-3 oxidase
MAGVYLSWPFCGQKCTYCNFASGVLPRDLEPRYEAALLAEVAGHRWEWTPETVYLGGGSPSRMANGTLARVAAAIPGKEWREFTLEAAPGEIAPEQVRAWRAAGVTRVSLGVQSFAERELRRTGRRHTAEIVARDCGTLRAEGIREINLDLICGLPGQTRESWRESLAWIERLAPTHVSVYLLEVDEDSRLGLEILNHGSRYGAGEAPGEELQTELYEYAVDELARQGIHRYEISNFARPGSESVHNLKYWKLEPYAAFGADAHSFDGRMRRQNAEDAREYVRRIERGEGAVVEESPADPASERFFVGLRLSEGIELTAAERAAHGAALERFAQDGLLEMEAGRARLTRRGVLMSNEVFQEFLPA